MEITNPSDEHGNSLTCHICQSILFFSDVCSHEVENPKVSKDDQDQNKTDAQQSNTA